MRLRSPHSSLKCCISFWRPFARKGHPQQSTFDPEVVYYNLQSGIPYFNEDKGDLNLIKYQLFYFN